jgi:diaminohydroxyphosphoribosylaminopyrimidine deaminase/5-amino-6-(5-phosphoribosylamino)uracil reductase
MYVTLEPCNHHGKTPPCVDAIRNASIKRVVVAMTDPHPKVAGTGIRSLRDAGIEVQVGICEAQARRLNAPYLHRLSTGCCWVIGKWAMSLDGKIATTTGESRWISNEQSRQIVHELRGRVDAIVVGRRTVERDDPLLTARPAGPRTATRVVLSSQGTIPPDSQLRRTAREIPVLVVASTAMSSEQQRQLDAWGCQTMVVEGADHSQRWRPMLRLFAERGWTNVLVEGGAGVLGDCLDAGVLNEWHLFLAPKLIGGAHAPSPFAGNGRASLSQTVIAPPHEIRRLGDDVYMWGPCAPTDPRE